MGKTIRINMTLDEVKEKIHAVANLEDIQEISDEPSELTAIFSKRELDTFFRMNECDGFRLYPAIYKNEVIMVAIPALGIDDLIDQKHFCLASNKHGALDVEGALEEDDVRLLPQSRVYEMLHGADNNDSVVDELRKIRFTHTHNTNRGLKALFKKESFDDKEDQKFIFEVVDLDLKEARGSTTRTIRFIDDLTKGEVINEISLLPCPPNCGGVYAPGSSSI